MTFGKQSNGLQRFWLASWGGWGWLKDTGLCWVESVWLGWVGLDWAGFVAGCSSGNLYGWLSGGISAFADVLMNGPIKYPSSWRRCTQTWVSFVIVICVGSSEENSKLFYNNHVSACNLYPRNHSFRYSLHSKRVSHHTQKNRKTKGSGGLDVVEIEKTRVTKCSI